MVECIIPAAGRSSRMISWKLFLPYAGIPVIEHSIKAGLEATDKVILVSGFKTEALKDYIVKQEYDKDRLTFIENEGYRMGMFSSIQTGMRCSEADEIFILLADLPMITSETLLGLLAYHRSCETSADIIQPVYEGVPGHPVLVNRRARDIILSLPPTSNMKEVISRCSYIRLPWEDPAIISDVDTPEAYQKLLDTNPD